VWLATGGRSGVNDRVDILKNRKILVFADWLIRWKQAPETMTLPADTTDTAGPAGTSLRPRASRPSPNPSASPSPLLSDTSAPGPGRGWIESHEDATESDNSGLTLISP